MYRPIPTRISCSILRLWEYFICNGYSNLVVFFVSTLTAALTTTGLPPSEKSFLRGSFYGNDDDDHHHHQQQQKQHYHFTNKKFPGMNVKIYCNRFRRRRRCRRQWRSGLYFDHFVEEETWGWLLLPLRLVYTMTKTRRFHVRLASCINSIKFFSDQTA